MAITMVEAKAAEFPKSKAVLIDGVECGTIEPRLYDDRLSWHAVIRMRYFSDISCGLLQGHGDTPDAALVAAIRDGRAAVERYNAVLLEIELACGTAHIANAHLERMARLPNGVERGGQEKQESR